MQHAALVSEKKLEDFDREIRGKRKIREQAEKKRNLNSLALTHARFKIKSLLGSVEQAKATDLRQHCDRSHSALSHPTAAEITHPGLVVPSRHEHALRQAEVSVGCQ